MHVRGGGRFWKVVRHGGRDAKGVEGVGNGEAEIESGKIWMSKKPFSLLLITCIHVIYHVLHIFFYFANVLFKNTDVIFSFLGD